MQAEADHRMLTGDLDVEPQLMGLSMVDFMTGTITAIGLLAALLEGHVPVAPVYGLDQAMDNPWLTEIGMRDGVPHPDRAELHVLASPIKLDGQRLPNRAGPLLGVDSDAILSELGCDVDAVGPGARAAWSDRAMEKLSGITLIDLTQFLPGPMMTVMMADHGARVIKIEPPGGEPMRSQAPFENGQSVWFTQLNRGKESRQLDLKSDVGKAQLRAQSGKGDYLDIAKFDSFAAHCMALGGSVAVIHRDGLATDLDNPKVFQRARSRCASLLATIK